MCAATSLSRAQGNDESDNKSDLLVFGYACKIFRDDEKAELIENGSHLIPWMGDEKLKIDRYDGRGALYDLTQYEAQNENNDWTDLNEDSEEDKLCEYERYRSLYLDEVTEQTYREELAKRTQADHAEISYEYDNPVNEPAAQDVNQEVDVTGSKPFVPPAELALPPNIEIPTTIKHNAIIVRTALFLAQQGSQMEILMKVKQQKNRNFDFLSHTDPLHEYYKHVLNLIKSGAYVPQEQYLEESEPPIKEEPEAGDHYLHPSLVTKLTSTNNPSPPPVQTEIKQKPPAPVETSPPDYVQKIIEKMVKYVIKNGPLFETAILKRGDVRFSFLNPKNPYNVFYKDQLAAKQKIIESNKAIALANNRLRAKEETKSEDDSSSNSSLKRKPLPVSFSIKKPKENENLEVPSALPVEESSDEEDSTQNSNSPKPPSSATSSKLADTVETSSEIITVNPLDKRLKKSAEITKKHRQRKDANLQNERKLKVAQFLKDLKKKAS
ncbi:hypothetical protein O3M35_010433 [Rhynocoris fuscipes]|uniref:SURP motif domain-containing protein n=1 Tax=Rhynocoris fuscipes TaxID=488301 RepID=A0AAW1D211_9HEMI